MAFIIQIGKPGRWLATYLGTASLLISSTGAAHAQADFTPTPAVKLTAIPPSPTSAALERAGSIPVGYYTGLPNVSVPLYTVQAGSVSVPIVLSYHASGLQAEDPGGWTGIGWSLAVGGTISRTVHGKPDEDPLGYWNFARESKNIGSLPCSPGRSKLLLFQRCATGTADLEPDVFSYNFAGQSGSFVIDTLGRKVLMPYRALQIAGGPRRADGVSTPFAITTAEGVRYEFGETEMSTTDDGSYTSSWHLTKIIPLHGPSIALRYSAGPGITQSSSTEEFLEQSTECSNGHFTTDHNFTSSSVWIAPKTVQAITWPGGEVRFFASPRRAYGTKLDSVQVRDGKGTAVKRFRLAYFEDAQRPAWLFLAQVHELAARPGDNKPPYRFFYDSFNAPYTSFAVPYGTRGRDHWGFYNGADNNATLLPDRYTGSGTLTRVPGGNREPDLAACRKGALTKLVYPTGGVTTFEYELNEYGCVENTLVPAHPLLGPPRAISVSTSCAYQAPGNAINCTGGGTKTFRIAAPQRVRVDWSIRAPYFTDQDGNEQGPQLTLTGPDPTKRYGPFNTNFLSGPTCTSASCTFVPQYYDLEPGTYTMAAQVAPPEIAGTATLTVTYRDSIGSSRSLPAGGLRIKRLTDTPTDQPTGGTSREFSYTLAADPTRSSGCLVSPLPDYYYNYATETAPDGKCKPAVQGTTETRFFKSYSTANLSQPGMTQGAFVGYREVSVTSQSPQLTGKSVYTFTSAYEQPDNGSVGFPFASRTSYDYARGLLLSETHYRYEGGQYLPVTQTRHTYRAATGFGSDALPQVDGWKIGYSTNNLVMELKSCFSSRIIHYRTGAMNLVESEQRTYAAADASLYTATTTRYSYENAAFPHPTAVETRLSDGQRTLSRQRYVFDYDTLAAAPGNAMAGALRLLRRRHGWLPVEQQTWRITGSDTTLTGAMLTLFDGRLVPSAQHRLRAGIPLRPNDYRPSLLRNGSFVYDTRLQEETRFDTYDGWGNLQQRHPSNGVPSSFLWDYSALQPIVEARNAPYTQVAFTSFEPGASGRFAYDVREGSTHRVPGGRTGRWAYRLNGTWGVSRDSLAAGEYELLFWAQSTQRPTLYGGAAIQSEQVIATASGNWNQFRLRIRLAAPGGIRLDVSATVPPLVVDEVRLCPVGAQMTSYTYDPLVGVTSQTDPAGRTFTYEYDALGRLVGTRDEQGRVLAQQQYHYAKP